jgi:hypothetical protein
MSTNIKAPTAEELAGALAHMIGMRDTGEHSLADVEKCRGLVDRHIRAALLSRATPGDEQG